MPIQSIEEMANVAWKQYCDLLEHSCDDDISLRDGYREGWQHGYEATRAAPSWDAAWNEAIEAAIKASCLHCARGESVDMGNGAFIHHVGDHGRWAHCLASPLFALRRPAPPAVAQGDVTAGQRIHAPIRAGASASIVERVARAICVAQKINPDKKTPIYPDPSWGKSGVSLWTLWTDVAAAAIAAISNAPAPSGDHVAETMRRHTAVVDALRFVFKDIPDDAEMLRRMEALGKAEREFATHVQSRAAAAGDWEAERAEMMAQIEAMQLRRMETGDLILYAARVCECGIVPYAHPDSPNSPGYEISNDEADERLRLLREHPLVSAVLAALRPSSAAGR